MKHANLSLHFSSWKTTVPMRRANLLFHYRSQKKAVTMKHANLSLHFSSWKTTAPMKRANLLFHDRSQKKAVTMKRANLLLHFSSRKRRTSENISDEASRDFCDDEEVMTECSAALLLMKLSCRSFAYF